MLSIIIATHDHERVLVRTLSTLVAGAAGGIVREVIVADAGSRDQTTQIADIAGCELRVSSAPLAQRLREAAAAARSPWLMFVRPGTVLDPSWVEETDRFVGMVEAQGAVDDRAAVFRLVPFAGSQRAALVEAFALIRSAFGGRPRPEQGLVIFKRLYERLGGHRDNIADPERDLLGRLGRRRVVTLRSAAMGSATDT